MKTTPYHKPQPSDLANIVLEVHQKLGQPRGLIPRV